ncbi:hypothetical protein LJC24_02125 [Desulfococcaceae bacterium OttesenSCG-928-F15]|nr:hypothetical protein [Desulfococcaceae bacterium OttesenSCG-928-F15]
MTLLLDLCPTESTYATKHNTSGYLRVELEGGMGRYRKGIQNPATIVSCRWVLGENDFNRLWAFYRTWLRKVEPFEIDLILEEYGLVRVLANILPDTFQLEAKQGPAHTITAQLEVQAPQYDAQDDEDYIYIINEFGPDYEEWTERLWFIVNVDYPVAMPVPPLYP